MKYSREYESQADILGAQILARAGYDPREMANMFKTLEEEGGASGPEWLSGTRIRATATRRSPGKPQSCKCRGAPTPVSSPDAGALQADGPAYTAEQIAKGQAPKGTAAPTPRRRPHARPVKVDPPSRAAARRTRRPTSFAWVSRRTGSR